MRAITLASAALTLTLVGGSGCGGSERGGSAPSGGTDGGAALGGLAGAAPAAGNSAGAGSPSSAGGGQSAGSDAGGNPSASGSAGEGAGGNAQVGGAGGSASGLVDCDTRKVICKRVLPECPAMQVPSVVGTCYGECVKIDRCACSSADQCPDADQYTCWGKMHCGPYVQ